MIPNQYKNYVIAVTVFLLTFSITVTACNVPVYRFALERWPADNYEVIVYHRGELTPGERSAIEILYSSSVRTIPYSNYILTTVNLETEGPGEFAELHKNLDTDEMPCLILRYPASSGIRKSIWHDALTEANACTLIDSPARRELAEHIIGGSSGVWVLLESGNRAKDNAAASLIESQLRKLEETLTLPQQTFETLLDSGQDSRLSEMDISFSLMRLPRSSMQESPLIEMLANSESDLSEYESSPIAFPVYGRGRALFPLIGEGISESNINAACAFLTGACSCEVKAINPGFDLLIKADWESGVGESWIEETNLPPLVGLSELLNDSGDSDVDTPFAEPAIAEIRNNSETLPAEEPDYTRDSLAGTEDGESSNNIFGNTLITVGILFIFISYMSSRIISRQLRRKK
ncbi:hypothetical protein ACFL6P_00430 [Candidatus Latescibacterota bacterium]